VDVILSAASAIRIPAYQTLLPVSSGVSRVNTIESAFTPLGFSTYHALQVQANKRLSRGLSFLWNYTFSKSIDNVRSAFGDTWGGNSGRPFNYYDLSLDKSISDADRANIFKIAAQYEVPFGKGHRFGASAPAPLEWALGGWTIQYIGNYESGLPLGITGSGTPNSNFATTRGFELNPNGLPLSVVWNSDQIDMTRISQPSAANKLLRHVDVCESDRDRSLPARQCLLQAFAVAHGHGSCMMTFRFRKTFARENQCAFNYAQSF
jgi:hypothetical protein